MVMNARQIIPLFACGIFIFGVTWCLLASPVHAADCGGVSTAILSSDACGTSEQGPMLGILTFTIKLLAVLIGIAAVGAIIYAGVLYSSAGNNNTQVQKSKSIITSTVIGIVLFAGMAAMLNWLVPGGVFSDNPSSWSQVSSTQPDSTTSTGGTNSDTSGNSSTSGSSGTTNTIVTAATYNIRATEMTFWDSTRANAILNYIKTVDIVGIQEGRSDSVP